MGRESLVEAMQKSHAIPVLSSLNEPHTVSEIVEDTDLPQPSVYRRLEELEGVGLVEKVGTKNDFKKGNNAKKYMRCVSKIEVDFEADDENERIKLIGKS